MQFYDRTVRPPSRRRLPQRPFTIGYIFSHPRGLAPHGSRLEFAFGLVRPLL